jgi:hypothetical protein
MGEHSNVKGALHDGEQYAGLIIGKEGKPDHHVVLLPGEAQDVSRRIADPA